jgi:Carboxypeptidase regulatory-like domain
MRISKKLLVILAVLPLAFIAKANNGTDGKTAEPALQGSVSDAVTKKPLQGVTISITSSKMNGEKEFTTDASGIFKANQIPAGEVTIILEKKGYKTYKREGVILKPGMSIKLNFDIKSEDEDSEVFHPLLRMMEGG